MKLNTIVPFRIGTEAESTQTTSGRERLYGLLKVAFDRPRLVIFGVNILLLSFLFKDTPIVLFSTPWDSPLVLHQCLNILLDAAVITVLCLGVFRFLKRSHIPLLGDLNHIDASMLRMDIDYLVERLQRYPRKNLQWESCIASLQYLQSRTKAGLSQREFAIQIAEKLSQLKDGHSGLDWDQQDFFQDMSQRALFPLELRSDRGRYFLVSEAAGQYKDREITRINGYDLDQLVSLMARFSRGDTEVDRKRQALRNFPVLLFILYGMDDDFSVVLDREEIQIAGIVRNLSTTEAQYDCQITQSGADQLHIKINNFSIKSLGHFGDYLATVDLTELDTILIDLSHCSGGKLQAVCDWLHILSKGNCHYYFSTKLDGKPLHFEGSDLSSRLWELDYELVLKIGPNTFSAAAIFAHLFKQNAIGKIYGSATGGSASCTGNPQAFDLPYSRLRCHLATTQIIAYTAGGRAISPNQSITPDVYIDVAEGI